MYWFTEARALLRCVLTILVTGYACIALQGCATKPASISFIAPQLADDMWQAAHTAADDAARSSGYTVSWNGPVRVGDFSRQIQLIDQARQSGSPGIIIVPDQPLALISPLRRVLSEQIPVVVVGSALRLPASDSLSYVLNDDEEEGRLGANRIGEMLHGAGSVAILGANPEIPGLAMRRRAFENTLAAHFPRITIETILSNPSDDNQAEVAARGVLGKTPRLKALFALNDSATLGAIRALRRTHKERTVLLVGCDQQYEALYYLSLGEVDSIIAEDTYQLGYRATQIVIDRRRGGVVPTLVLVKPLLVTKDNMYSPRMANVLSWDWRSVS